ncbi:LOW QUALITY PROTEIN: hypothetical protein ColTof4_12410 [Colletotrichum tofieldiae]|nr:LOW QUALITY PROTEIN: hypothetical protein ColTof4_12410 [Colletotrichum tofieldiae]
MLGPSSSYRIVTLRNSISPVDGHFLGTTCEGSSVYSPSSGYESSVFSSASRPAYSLMRTNWSSLVLEHSCVGTRATYALQLDLEVVHATDQLQDGLTQPRGVLEREPHEAGAHDAGLGDGDDARAQADQSSHHVHTHGHPSVAVEVGLRRPRPDAQLVRQRVAKRLRHAAPRTNDSQPGQRIRKLREDGRLRRRHQALDRHRGARVDLTHDDADGAGHGGGEHEDGHDGADGKDADHQRDAALEERAELRAYGEVEGRHVAREAVDDAADGRLLVPRQRDAHDGADEVVVQLAGGVPGAILEDQEDDGVENRLGDGEGRVDAEVEGDVDGDVLAASTQTESQREPPITASCEMSIMTMQNMAYHGPPKSLTHQARALSAGPHLLGHHVLGSLVVRDFTPVIERIRLRLDLRVRVVRTIRALALNVLGDSNGVPGYADVLLNVLDRAVLERHGNVRLCSNPRLLRHQNNGPALQQVGAETPLPERSGSLRVEGREDVVEQEQRRLGVQRPGQGHARLLTPRERGAVLADDGLVAVVHLPQVDGQAARVDDVVVAHRFEGAVEEDVLLDALVLEPCRLRRKRDVLGPGDCAALLDCFSQYRQQQRRLPAAAGARHDVQPTSHEVDRHVLELERSRLVPAERRVLDPEGPLGVLLQRRRALKVLVQTANGNHGARHVPRQEAELCHVAADGLDEVGGREGRGGRQGLLAHAHVQGEHGNHGNVGHEGGDLVERHVDERHAPQVPLLVRARLLDGLDDGVLPRKVLDRADGGEVFRHERDARVLRPSRLPGLPGHQLRHKDGQGRGEEQNGRAHEGGPPEHLVEADEGDDGAGGHAHGDHDDIARAEDGLHVRGHEVGQAAGRCRRLARLPTFLLLGFLGVSLGGKDVLFQLHGAHGPVVQLLGQGGPQAHHQASRREDVLLEQDRTRQRAAEHEQQPEPRPDQGASGVREIGQELVQTVRRNELAGVRGGDVAGHERHLAAQEVEERPRRRHTLDPRLLDLLQQQERLVVPRQPGQVVERNLLARALPHQRREPLKGEIIRRPAANLLGRGPAGLVPVRHVVRQRRGHPFPRRGDGDDEGSRQARKAAPNRGRDGARGRRFDARQDGRRGQDQQLGRDDKVDLVQRDVPPLQVVDEPQEAEHESVGHRQGVEPGGLAAGAGEGEEGQGRGAGELGGELPGPSDGCGVDVGPRR